MSIGDALAAARRQAGLTIEQVSQRTCIRESIIRGIEQNDFSACGGDFYARGHIRGIARAVGADPGPLVSEYDATQGAARPISAKEVFEPASPIRIRERRRLNWSLALSLVLLAAVSFGVYKAVTHVLAHPTPAAAHAAAAHKPAAAPPARHKRHHHHHAVVIELTAVSDCWVQLTTTSGRDIFTGMLYSGTAKKWTEHRAVQLQLGNPAGVTLRVNGKNAVPANSSQPITLTLGPGRGTAG
ncbi:MAG: helix-turn-helix domain-containing protein [Streptosporangiaceae bacterium]